MLQNTWTFLRAQGLSRMSYNSKAYTWYNLSISKTIYKKINGEFKEKKTQIWKKSTVSKHLKKQISKLMRLISSQK